MSESTKSIFDQGQELISKLLAHPADASGQDFNDLLSLFFRGLPITNLGALLECPNTNVQMGALFVAEELGDKATPVLPNVIGCLDHKEARIRYSAYNAAASCSSRGDPSAFVHVVLGIRDSDAACRKIAILWLMRVEEFTLRATLRALEVSGSELEIQTGLRMLLEDFANASRITDWMLDERPLVRKFGAIAAGRAASTQPELLKLAASSDDSDLRISAAAQMHFLALRQKHRTQKA
jgi:hypothetical protein